MEASKLKEILDQHLLWYQTNGVQGEPANLRGADLGGANLMNANLIGANLIGANLMNANLIGANLMNASLYGADLEGADLGGANLWRANLWRANLTNAILPDISWIIPGCLVQLNQISCPFYLAKEDKCDNFVQDSFGFFIQNNREEDTFDMLVEDRIIRSIPDWVKYSGLKQIASESV